MSTNLEEEEEFEVTVVSNKESDKQAHVPLAIAF